MTQPNVCECVLILDIYEKGYILSVVYIQGVMKSIETEALSFSFNGISTFVGYLMPKLFC